MSERPFQLAPRIARRAVALPRPALALRPGWAAIIAAWALSRLVVIASILVLEALGKPRGFFIDSRFRDLGALGSWDGRWYTMVVERGYLLVEGSQSDPAFFPFYPVLVRALHALGLPVVAAGALLSNLVLLVALVALLELGRALAPEDVARRAAVYAAVWPVGFVFSMVYPQSLVLAAMAGAGLAALRGRWILCAFCAGAAALARPEGAFVALPIAAAALARRRELGPRERGLALGAVAAGPVALLAYPVYLGFALHDPFAWGKAQRAWGRAFEPHGVVDAFTSFLPTAPYHPGLWRDVGFLALYLVLLGVAWWRGVPRSWVLAGALVVLLPLGSGSLDSVARFGLLALPVYWGLAFLTRRPVAHLTVVALCVIGLVTGILTLPLAFP